MQTVFATYAHNVPGADTVVRRCAALSAKFTANPRQDPRHLIPSMRTIGNGVNEGRLRRWPGQVRRSGADGCRPGCCTLLLHCFLVAACLGVHFMVSADLDVPSSEAVCSA